jgi:UDP-N-acetylmuramate--alanine ligase
MPGRHNVLNALAAISVAHALHHPLEQAAKTLSNFPGVHRRLQRYPSKQALIFDDYAHNPGKIASCIAGLREAFPERRLVVCFQPHRYSRLSSLYVEFMTCFRAPNICVVALPVYAAGEAAIKGFESERLASDIAKLSSVESFSAPTLKAAYELLKSKVDPNKDVVVTIGAGDVWQLALRLSQEL